MIYHREITLRIPLFIASVWIVILMSWFVDIKCACGVINTVIISEVSQSKAVIMFYNVD